FRQGAVDDLRDRPCRSASVRPAERPMTGVQEQTLELAHTDIRDIARRGGSQTRPIARPVKVATPTEDITGPFDNRQTASLVELRRVAIELRRAGNAHLLA